jgi:hypothetical protein
MWALLAGCEVDHVISRKHGGITDVANLAWSCARCNRAKGTDIGSVDPISGAFTRLFNPRIDVWGDHFVVEHGLLVGQTGVGRATIRLLRLNADERVQERRLFQALGDYPGPLAPV